MEDTNESDTMGNGSLYPFRLASYLKQVINN